MKLNIFYFAYLVSEIDVFLDQVNLLKSSGLYNKANKIYISIQTAKNNLCGGSIENDKEVLKALSTIPLAEVIYKKSEDLYEYPGLKLAWDEAQKDKSFDSISLYFHTKGIATRNLGNTHIRKILEKTLLIDYENILNKFKLNLSINKIGLYKSLNGFLWFNFFYVRNSYLAYHKEPIISSNRYYYEEYIKGKGNEDTIAIGNGFASDDGNQIIKFFAKQY